jgi:hypothetical protein
MKQIDDLIKKIGQCIVGSIPINLDWDFVKYSTSILITYSESQGFVTKNGNEKSISVKFKDENGKAIHPNFVWQLREAMYETAPNKGAWYSMDMQINKNGKFDIKFDYNNKPNFSIPIEELDFIRDYEKFPRQGEIIPDWLNKILTENNIQS